ncbi:MAG TPA: hypothetical protein DCG38_05035 [Eubacteriaceae bacterium]|jgi:ABC-2 type transport system permease protein|nr:hypothetical protein [Eubacteriaceae bacterium]
MSIVLLKKTLKRNWVLWAIFFGVLTMYMTIMVYMYDPDDIQALIKMVEIFPEELMNAMGFAGFTDITGYLASWLYGMLMMAFPMVYCIILGNRLVAKMVDDGSMAYLLSTPNSRSKIIVTQGIYALASVAFLFAALFAVGVAISEMIYPGLLYIKGFLMLNITTMLVNMFVVMIVFFFSCLFNDIKYSTGFGAGIPIVFFLMNLLGGVSEDASIIKNLSIYGLYDPLLVATESTFVWANFFYLAGILIFFIAGIVAFDKKRLPL